MWVGIGSGVIINSDGYIVMNNYVIVDVDDLEVIFYDNWIYKVVMIGIDFIIDLVLF